MPASNDWRVWCCGVVCEGNPYGWRAMHYHNEQTGECQWHSMPQGDLKPHTGPGCWCEPELLPDKDIWAHRSVDLREEYELGLRLPH